MRFGKLRKFLLANYSGKCDLENEENGGIGEWGWNIWRMGVWSMELARMEKGLSHPKYSYFSYTKPQFFLLQRPHLVSSREKNKPYEHCATYGLSCLLLGSLLHVGSNFLG